MILPKNISARLDSLSAEGNHLADAGKHSDAIDKWTKALELVPEPKTQWEASTWLYSSMGDSSYQQGAFASAKALFLDALNCPDGLKNPFILYRLGQCEVRLGNEANGLEYLLRAYMLDGEEIFRSDQQGHEFLTMLSHKGLV